MEKPDNNRITVFNIGTPQGFKKTTFTGGHTDPMNIDGDKLEWKKAQKKPEKNITSVTKNKIKPNFIPLCTTNVWWPWYVDSLITSLHQTNKIDININKPKKNT